MHLSIPLLIVSFVYLLMILVLFLTKKKQRTVENSIYLLVLVTTIIGVLVDIAGIYSHMNLAETSFIRWFIVKVYMFYLLSFIYLITIYIISVAKKVEEKVTNFKELFKYKIVKYLTAFYFLSFILNFVLPFEYIKEDNIVYIQGPNSYYLYLLTGIALLSWFLYILIKNRKITRRKILPIFLFILIAIPVILIQFSNPELLLITSLSSFLTVFMYHTIENPDVNMIEELVRNKQLANNLFEDKSIYLFKMTQRVKEPINKINKYIKEYRETSENKDKDTIFDNIEINVKGLTHTINEVTDVTTLDSSKIKVMNSTYNTYNFFENLNKRVLEKIKDNNNISYYSDLSKTLPKELYGDSVKLKQVLTTLLNNSIEFTENGVIELDVECISYYDLCRLIITIKDTGKGMKLNQINDILSGEITDEQLKKINEIDLNIKTALAIIKLLGGSANIKSEIGVGTEITIIIDQKVKQQEKSEISSDIDKYSAGLFNRRVLIVDNESEEINKIVRILTKEEIQTNISMFGKDCIDKVKAGEKYKLILMDDEMKPDNALPTLEKLKEIKKFNIPVIVMLNKEKEFIKEHYIKDGFTDYLLKNDLEKEIKRIIEKHL